MIIQGSNNPLTIKFDADVSNMEKLIVTLWSTNAARRDKLIKRWDKNINMTVQKDTAICPIEENETAILPDEQLVVEAKGLQNGQTVFWSQYSVDVLRRRDRIIYMTQEG